MSNETEFTLRRVPKSALIVPLLLGAIALSYTAFTEYIPPDHVAIKESKFGGGIQGGTLDGGRLYFRGIGVTFHQFPKTWQVLDFNAGEFERGLNRTIEGYRVKKPLTIPSSEGFRNTFEMSVVYRIANAATLIDKEKGVGRGRLYEAFVQTKAAPALKEAFGRLAAEELYDVEKRQAPAEEAKKLLNRELNPVGIEVKEVLVRRFDYIPSYERKISAKVLQRKLKVANEEQTKAATVVAAVSKINAEGQAVVDVEIQRADKQKRVILAEANLYRRSQNAQGGLLVQEARAKGQELVNRAYEGSGSQRIVGIEMAKKAKAIKSVYMTSCKRDGINPLDLSDLMGKLTQ